MKTAILLLLSALGLSAQTCTITSPTSAQLFQYAGWINLTATVSSAPTAWKATWSVDYQIVGNAYARNTNQHPVDAGEAWTTPFSVGWNTGLQGDGAHTASVNVYNITGTLLASCTQSFTVRIEGMSNQFFNLGPPTTGVGAWGIRTYDGTREYDWYVDGYALDGVSNAGYNWCGRSGATSQSGGGGELPNVDTTCFTNGTHLLMASANIGGISDPYLLPLTFTSSNVSGNNITIENSTPTTPGHYSLQGSVVTFSTTGTLPAPLNAGTPCYWKVTTCTISSLSASGQSLTVNLNTATGATTGTSIYIRNLHYTTTAGAVCDGLYTATSGSGTSFVVTMPAACDTSQITSSLYDVEVDVNPYFVIYNSLTSISVSASCSPCTDGPNGQHPLPGTAVTLTNGGSGTHTVTQRIRSPYWLTWPNADLAGTSGSSGGGGPANVYQLVTFSNGSAPMELEIPYWQIYLQTGGSTLSVCPKIKNTDLTFTSPACNASGLTYTLVNDGGFTASSVISISSSGVVSPVGVGVAQILVAGNATYAGNANGLMPQTIYVQVCSGPCPFPTFTHNGTVSQTFSPGNSFFFTSNWFLDPKTATGWNNNVPSRPLWYGSMMQHSNINTFLIAPDASNTNLGDPGATSCFSATFPSTMHTYENAFATSVPGFPMYYELDLESTQWGVNATGYIAAFLNNTGFNRTACYTSFMNQLVAEGRTTRIFSYDELNEYMAGSYPFRNPNLGSTDFPTITVSGGVATYNVGESFQGVWNPTGTDPFGNANAGTGSWVKMAGAVTNTCLNGWFPVTAITNNGGGYPISFTTPTTCANGTYTESTAQLYHYYASTANPPLGENAATLPRVVGAGCCSAASNYQRWDSTYFTQIVVSGCNGTTCTAEFYAPSHGIANGQAVRVYYSTHGLNTVAPVTVIDSSHFSITYNVANNALPANGTYNSSNDSGLLFSVDGNLPPTPFLSLRNIFASITGNPANTWGAIGVTYSVGNPAVKQWEGNSIGADATWNYNILGAPGATLGDDATVWQWMTLTQPSSGLATKGYQFLGPRSMLWAGTFDYVNLCQSASFNPACDRPQFLLWRPEGVVAQLAAMMALGASGLRSYGASFNQTNDYTYLCCGWTARGTGQDTALNPFTTPNRWHAMAETQALIKSREGTFLQPPCNKQFFGPLFITDCHTSATYGNQFTITCGSEMPYGAFSVNLNAISGGSTIMYRLDGYSLTVSTLAGNPSTHSQEWCDAPGVTYVIVSQPPGHTALDTISFPAKSPIPYGAAKYMLQVGYYPEDMRSDPVTDCTSGCTISIDHHNLPAYYRVIYADSNSLPVATGSPNTIASQGLY